MLMAFEYPVPEGLGMEHNVQQCSNDEECKESDLPLGQQGENRRAQDKPETGAHGHKSHSKKPGFYSHSL